MSKYTTLCISFKTDKIPKHVVETYLKDNHIPLVDQRVYCPISWWVHFYVKHRYAIRVKELFGNCDHFEIRISRFYNNHLTPNKR